MSIFASGQPQSVIDSLGGETIRRALLLEMKFKSGPVYVSDWNVPFRDSLLGREWQGLGDLVGIGNVTGGDTLAPYREYVLGIPAKMLEGEGIGRIPELIGNRDEFVGREANLYMQMFDAERLDENGMPVILGNPFAIDLGLMDRVEASWSPGVAVLKMTVEGMMARKGAPIYGLLTNRDQRRRHPGDKGLRFVPEVMSKSVKWLDF